MEGVSVPIYTTRKLVILLIISIIIGVVAVSATSAGVRHFLPPAPKTSNLQNQRVWYIPGNNLLFNETISKLRDFGVPVNSLDPVEIVTNQTLSNVATSNSIILFDSAWVAARVSDNQTLTFLRLTGDKGAKLVVVGDQTSTLFDALKNAGVINFQSRRNPGSFNAPMAGFRFKTSVYANQYPSYLESNTTDTNALVDALNEWTS